MSNRPSFTSSPSTARDWPGSPGSKTSLSATATPAQAYTDRFYKEVCKARLQPVLDTITLMHALGVWVEVTTLVIPGWNDSDAELRDIARFLKSISADIPWHVTRFWPTFEMTDRPPTPHATLIRAREIGLAEGLRYVYVGNIPGEEGENTYCAACGTLLVERLGFSIGRLPLAGKGACPQCGTRLPGIFAPA